MKLNHLIIIGALCGALLLPSSASSWGVVGLSAGGGGTTCSGNYGQTGDGSSNSESSGLTWIYRINYDCTADAGATTFNYRLSAANTNAREVVFLIYADNGSGTDPGELLWQSDPLYWEDTKTVQWKTATVDEALSGTYLWIGAHFESSSTNYYYTSVTGATGRKITNNGTFPDVDSTWDTANDSSGGAYEASCYLSY